jgi:hypothetical protein
MNPGPVEEVGSTARGFISAMGSNPVMLGMVLVVLALIAMLFVTLRFAAEARKTEFEMIFAQQKEVQSILSRCVVVPAPGPTGAAPFRLQSGESHPVILPPRSIIPPFEDKP